MSEYYELRNRQAFQYVKPHPGRLELEDDPGLGVQIKYKDTVHEIYGLCFLDEAAKKGKHTELTCTCVDGWCQELCFPKIHVMMNEDEHKCKLAVGVRTKEDIKLKAREAFEKQDVRAMVDAYYELRLWDGMFRYVNSKQIERDNPFAIPVKYENKLHVVSGTLWLSQAAKTATHTGIKCDCYDACCGKLCYPKIHAMLKYEQHEDMGLQALGLQSEQETNLKKLYQIRLELVQNVSRFEKLIQRARFTAVQSKNVEFITRLNAKMVECHEYVSGLVDWHRHVSSDLPVVEAHKRGRETPHAREDTTTSSVNSASVSKDAHRADSASRDDASSHSAERHENAVYQGLPGKKPKTSRESRETLQAIATNVI